MSEDPTKPRDPEHMPTAVRFETTRFLFQRALGLIYLTAFLIVLNQFLGLCGSKGILPIENFISQVDFWQSPSLFHFWHSDAAIRTFGWLGFLLSVFAASGFLDRYSVWVSAGTWFLLWVLYLSFVNAGQLFYGFGWEILLCETGFLAIFLGPRSTPASVVMKWLLRWLAFRLMFGAGMIKIRGDECWRDLTCLIHHYETQPLPNPLSWFFHHLPEWIHNVGVVFNHFVELIVPFGFFGPRKVRIAAGLITIFFQGMLILSGNLAWLNWMTVVILIACFDDSFFRSLGLTIHHENENLRGGFPRAAIYALAVLIGVLSINPVRNLFSSNQTMNGSFDPIHLVNTYGAFGSVGQIRDELIIEGTKDQIVTNQSEWEAYEFHAKPGDTDRMPPQVSPYYYKLDWQIWFAAMGPYNQSPWMLSLIGRLLANEPSVTKLLQRNPFKDKPPSFIRVRTYRYRFTDPHEPGWWARQERGEYLPPLSLKE